MNDVAIVIRDFLLADAGLVALVGDRIHAEKSNPPAGYKPSAGPCICFKVRGGGISSSDALLLPSVQFLCYAADEVTANTVYQALVEALHNGRGAEMRWGQSETLGQTLRDPETGWPFVLCHFTCSIVASLGG